MTTASPWTIAGRRATIERAGRRVRYFRAWPRIGRGGVRHDLASHDEIERMIDRGMNPSLLRRIANFMEGRPWR